MHYWAFCESRKLEREDAVKVIIVAGARPNFMKIAPLLRAIDRHNAERGEYSAGIEYTLVHTGQHYDSRMSAVFFAELGMPQPDINLEVGSASHAVQTASIMVRFEEVCLAEKPDWVLVVGDVNSTMACTLVAKKLGMNVGHIEAGLRSYDRNMPEEINRIVTDALADLLFTPSRDAGENLAREGVSPDKIRFVGNIMIDSLEMMRERIEQQETFVELGLEAGKYGLVTMHRPSNVDDPATLQEICALLRDTVVRLPLVFPIHPRTRGKLEENGLLPALATTRGLTLLEPLSYVSFMNLVFNSCLVVTDSGGVQEETSYLGIPCFTVRENTERPITVTEGTNRLCRLSMLQNSIADALSSTVPARKPIELWDGGTAERIVAVLANTGTAIAPGAVWPVPGGESLRSVATA